MANTNDARILELKKQIQEKKEKLGKISKFTAITNCSLELDGVRYNINTFNKEQLIHMLVKLNALRLSAKDLGLLDKYEISLFKVEDWITDLQSKLDILTKKDEERALKVMEDKLSDLLSADKKVELEIDAIASAINS